MFPPTLRRAAGLRTATLAAAVAAAAVVSLFTVVLLSPAAVRADELPPLPIDFGTAHEYAPATAGGQPRHLMADATGVLWYDDNLSNQIVAHDPGTGVDRVYDLGPTHPAVSDLVLAPDGGLWFTDYANAAIARLDQATGTLLSYPLGGPFDSASALVLGPDGALWFGDPSSGGLGRIALDGRIDRIPIPGGWLVTSIVAGGDGRLWFTEDGVPLVNRYDIGTATFAPLLVGTRATSELTLAADGGVWVGAFDEISHVALDDTVVTTPIPGAPFDVVLPANLVAGQSAQLYFTDESRGIGIIALDGTLRFLRPPFTGSTPSSLAVTPDGTLWYADFARSTFGSV